MKVGPHAASEGVDGDRLDGERRRQKNNTTHTAARSVGWGGWHLRKERKNVRKTKTKKNERR